MSRDKETGKKEFITEAEEILEELTSDIHQLESSIKKNSVKPEQINKIFREFHSLKGISGMLGFQTISGLTHELESLLDKLRLGRVPLDRNIIHILDQALDMLNRLITEVSRGGGEKSDTTSIVNEINELLSRQATQTDSRTFPELTLDAQTLGSLTEYEEHRLRESINNRMFLYSIRLVFDTSTFDQELRQVNNALNEDGEILSTLPCFDTTLPQNKIVFQLIFATKKSKESLQKKLPYDDATVTDLYKKTAPTTASIIQTEQETENVLEQSTLKSLSPTLRVDVQKLDDLMNTIGELVITKAAITHISRELTSIQGFSQLGLALSRSSLDLEKKLSEIQRGIVEIRLVRIGQIYNKLTRMVRKLSQETNKSIDFQTHGEDTELDKIMIEQLSDPLMHLIRNSIDHGIEGPKERIQLGKPEAGLIRLSAFQRGNSVVIQIQDDGRGIQLKKVRDQARKRGLIGEDQEMSMQESIDLIFTPGFTSSDGVTELSGRGVGLDVVKKNIAELRGTITVVTHEGKGCQFEITLPITLAIIQALIVETEGHKYAVPLNSVLETVRVFSHEIQSVDSKEVYYLRDRTIPLIRISEVFHLPNGNKREKQFILVVKAADQYAGLLVDTLVGQQEIVIKSMGERLKDIRGIAGATEIGDNKPILVLDPESMVQEATHGTIRAM